MYNAVLESTNAVVTPEATAYQNGAVSNGGWFPNPLNAA